jgi:hemolysin activation/secretion protein
MPIRSPSPLHTVAKRRTQLKAVALTATVCLLPGLVLAQPSSTLPRNPQEAQKEPQPASREGVLSLPNERFFDQAPAGADRERLRLHAVQLIGNQALSTEALQPLWQAMLGQDVTLQQLYELAARITARYREAGYALSQVIVPVQDLQRSGATVQLRVIEAYIGAVRVNPADARGAAQIRAALGPVLAEKPVTLVTLENRLLALNDLPGVSAQANIAPGAQSGASDIELSIQQRRFSGSASLHNRVSKATGPVRLDVGVDAYGLFGAFDHHGLRVNSSGNNRLMLLSYNGDASLSVGGASVSWSLSQSRSKPQTGAAFNLDTDSTTAAFGVSYPLLRGRMTNLSLRGNLSSYNGKTELRQTGVLEAQQLRTLRLGVSADRSDTAGGINLLDVELTKGLTGLGASTSEQLSSARFGVKPGFTKLNVYAARLQDLGGAWSALLAVQGQHTSDLLPNAEQFGLGGDVFLRGYSPSEILGDKGFAAKLEVRWNQNLGAVAATMYAYAETGRTTLRGVFGDPNVNTTVHSYGLGLRATLPGGLRGYLEIAKPQGRDTDRGNQEARGFAGLAWTW